MYFINSISIVKGHPRRILYILCGLVISLPTISWSDTDLLESCDEYVELLSTGRRQTATDISNCILYEQIILQSENWPEFITVYQENIHSQAHPVLIASGLEALENGSLVDAFVLFDFAIRGENTVFVRLQDPEREILYSHVFTLLRNQMLTQSVNNNEFLEAVSSVYISANARFDHVDSFRSYDGDLIDYIKCLISTDAFTVPLGVLLESHAFNTCLKENLNGW